MVVVVVVVVAHHIPAGQSGPLGTLGSGAHHQPTQVTPHSSVSLSCRLTPESQQTSLSLSVCLANLELIKTCTCPGLLWSGRHQLTCNPSGDVC